MKEETLVFLDTETTGLREYDRIVQLAFAYDGKVVNEFINPLRKISEGASAVNHITDDMVKNSPVFKKSLGVARLKTLIDKGAIIVAHNAPFDISMLEKEGLKCGKFIDTMRLAMVIKKAKLESYPAVNLQALIDYYGIELGDEVVAHDAEGDVMRLVAVFDHLKKYFSSVDEMVEVSRN